MLSFILYQIYQLIRGTTAINIFVAVLLVYFLYLVVRLLKMELMTMIMEQFIGVGVLALIILFQQEIRRFLLHIGSNYTRNSRNSILRWFFKDPGKDEYIADATAIVAACAEMAETKTGALIVLGNPTSLSIFAETGVIMNAIIHEKLLLSIFYKNSPLHDGAVIISNNKIYAARCILPSSDNMNIPSHYGMRHRAAIGITEATNAIAVVVSEETGRISYARNGKLESRLSPSKLKELLLGPNLQ